MKVDLLTLYADNSCTLKRVEVDGTKLKAGKSWKPTLVPGVSVFPERQPLKRSFYRRYINKKRLRRIAIAVHGAEECYSLAPKAGKLDDHWSTDEAESFINKVIAWAAAKTKLFSKMEVYIFWLLLIINLIFTLLMLRRIGL